MFDTNRSIKFVFVEHYLDRLAVLKDLRMAIKSFSLVGYYLNANILYFLGGFREEHIL